MQYIRSYLSYLYTCTHPMGNPHTTWYPISEAMCIVSVPKFADIMEGGSWVLGLLGTRLVSSAVWESGNQSSQHPRVDIFIFVSVCFVSVPVTIIVDCHSSRSTQTGVTDVPSLAYGLPR